MSEQDDRPTYRHAECGTEFRIHRAIDGETWCPECSRWLDVSEEVVKDGE